MLDHNYLTYRQALRANELGKYEMSNVATAEGVRQYTAWIKTQFETDKEEMRERRNRTLGMYWAYPPEQLQASLLRQTAGSWSAGNAPERPPDSSAANRSEGATPMQVDPTPDAQTRADPQPCQSF